MGRFEVTSEASFFQAVTLWGLELSASQALLAVPILALYTIWIYNPIFNKNITEVLRLTIHF